MNTSLIVAPQHGVSTFTGFARCKSNLGPVIEAVSQHSKTAKREITGEGRTRRIVNARWMVWHIARSWFHMSYPRIGQLSGGFDHTTVLHALRIFPDRLDEHPALRETLELVLNSLEMDLQPNPFLKPKYPLEIIQS